MKQKNNNFRNCIEHYFEKKEFFTPWFRKYGKSYIFIFKKNLKVTNIQYAELISLIKANIRIQNHGNNSNIQFLTVSDFNNTVGNLFKTFNYSQHDENEKIKILDILEKYYSSIFNHMIVVDLFYGSCAIFLPNNIELNIENVCAQSGYIHSCGDNIFLRKINKAEKELFFNNLTEYLKTNYKDKEDKIPFTVYSHEDFTPFDRDEGEDFFANGLDDIKFHVEKFYMQSTPLIEIISEMRKNETLNKKLEIAGAGDYHRNIKGNNDNSIWLIIDRAVLEHSTHPHPSKEIFFICYDQKFINENPYHLFEENKPGWIDHTTIPHTLMGAMLNIAIPIAKRTKSKNEKISILDPFVGSGTTYLESVKYYPNIEFYGSDSSKLTPVVTDDNFTFFCLSSSELTEIYLQLRYCELKNYKDTNKKKFIENKFVEATNNISKSEVNKLKQESQKNYRKAFEFFITYELGSDISEINQQTILENLPSFNERIMFYLFHRAYKRNFNAFERGSKDLTNAFIKEVADLSIRIENLIRLKKRTKIDTDNKNALIKYIANYSYGCSINPNVFTDFKANGLIKGMTDAIDELKGYLKTKKLFDIIITDPPYGFNTEEDPITLAKLYHKMIDLMIKSLKPNGQLLLCLPEISNTGRQIYYFTQKEIVTHQILIVAAENERTLILPVNILPRPTWLFKAPYYWESEKALRRAILHFVLK